MARSADDLYIHRTMVSNTFAVEGSRKLFINGGIAGFPDAIAGTDFLQVEIMPTKTQESLTPTSTRRNRVDSTALFF